jgi:hypothetical protein
MLVLRRLRALPRHTFWTDDVALSDSPHVDGARLVGHRQVTDAHLVALALRHGGRLATFDRGLRDVVPSGVAPDSVLTFLG